MSVLAFDLGASSGRGILANLENGKIVLKEVHRFENDGVYVRGTWYWDILHIIKEIKTGMVKAKLAGGFDSVGIDTWGVDFGLIDAEGNLIDNPVHYRDGRTDGMMEELFKIVSKDEVYEKTGLQFMNLNTLYQLYYLSKYKPDILKRADRMLFIPDLLNYFLTGEKASEYTIASTSQCINARDKTWDFKLIEKCGIPKHLLNDIISSGTTVGNITDDICKELGIESASVVAVSSHDTASAVVSVPTDSDDFAYISCGTWSLFGTELPEPLISEEGENANYTNEGGYGGTIRFLTNIMGLWLIQESRRTWIKQGHDLSYNDLERAALECEEFKCYIDPDYDAFSKPGDIPKHIGEYCEKTLQYVPKTIGETVRCIYESLALKYRHSFENLKYITGKDFKKIYIVGGGTKDPLLCQLTANACGVPVSAGPVEATALGNIAVQLMAKGEIKDVKQAREIIKKSSDIKEYSPKNTHIWDKEYLRYKNILKSVAK